MSEPLPKSICRILLAFGEENDVTGTFEAAAGLAQRLNAELHGLYLEDIDLLHLAGLPFARETGTTTAVTRRLRYPDIERGWQQQAARLQKNLSDIAARRQLRWSFQVLRGRMTALATEVTTTDVVAVSAMTRSRVEVLRTLPGPVLILPPVAAPGSAVGVLMDETPESEAALGFADTLVPDAGGDALRVIVVSAPDTHGQTRQQTDHMLSAKGVRARVLSLAVPEAVALTSLLKTSAVGTLVLPAGIVARSPWLRAWLERPSCAVWVMR